MYSHVSINEKSYLHEKNKYADIITSESKSSLLSSSYYLHLNETKDDIVIFISSLSSDLHL